MGEECFEINFWIEFWPGDHPDTNYPGEDKLWLATYLDEAPYGFGDDERWTVDCESCELPMVFLAKNEGGRNTIVAEHMEEAIHNAAVLLERYKGRWDVSNYRVNPKVDVMNVVSEW